MNCNIIIPVYNEYDSLKKCLESVLLFTNLKTNKLIIIDDKSTDENIIPFISDFISHKQQDVIFIKNDEKKGLLKTINIGIASSKEDVLLLSPNTEVTKEWLERIQICAYNKENTATVTPIVNSTNNSVAKYCQTKVNKNNFAIDNYSEYIDKISYKDYPEIPTGEYFCLYIKRNVLDIVGSIDEKSYKRIDFAIEDFCYRCLDKGFRHILCDDVIVFYDSLQLLNDNYQNSLVEKNDLLKKYPIHIKNTGKWINNYHLRYISKNISYNMSINNDKKNILILLHLWSDNTGTSIHVFDIIKELRNKYNFHVLVPDNNVYHLFSYWDNGEETMEIFSQVSQGYINRFVNLEYITMLEKIIDSFNIDIIHIHHMIGHFFNIIYLLEKMKIYLIISLHDFYAFCPRIYKINYNNVYCRYPDENECNKCLKSYNFSVFGVKEGKDITDWINNWNLLFSYANKIIVPSNNTREEILYRYKNISVDVIEHGININKQKKPLNIDDDKEFNIAFIGTITEIKGKKIIEELIKYSQNFDDNIYFHLFGFFSNNSNVSKKKYKNFIDHSEYNRNNLGKLLMDNSIKLVCIFSITPETYSYTLSESIANNVPVLAIDEGAVGQRIKENNWGWLIKNGTDISEIYKIIKKIFNEKKEYKQISEKIAASRIKNVQEMGNDYNKVYSSLKINKIQNNSVEKIKYYIKENSNDINHLPEIGNENRFLKRMKKVIIFYKSYGFKYTNKLIIKKCFKLK